MNRRAAIAAASLVSATVIGASAAVAAGSGLFGSPEAPGVGQLPPVLEPGSAGEAADDEPAGERAPRGAGRAGNSGRADDASEPRVSRPGGTGLGSGDAARATQSARPTSSEDDDEDEDRDEWEDDDTDDDSDEHSDKRSDKRSDDDAEDREDEFEGHDDDD